MNVKQVFRQCGTAVALLAVTMVVAGCAGSSSGTQVLAKSKAPTKGTAVEDYDPPSLHGDLARAISSFGVQLLASVADENGNTVVSPFSAYSALGLVEGAADGETLEQMRTTLGTKAIEPGTANARYADMLAQLQFKTKDTPARLDIANSIWLGTKLKDVDQAFIDRDMHYFGAQIARLDMGSASAPGVVNRWVRDNTAGRIEKLVDALDPQTVAVLCNAVYFKDAWWTPFNASRTEDRDFRLAGGTTVKVPTMAGGADGSFIDTDTYQAVALPTKSGASCWIFVPKGDRRPADVLAALKATYESGQTLRSVSSPGIGEIYLPKFDIAWKGSLAQPLADLGMPRAFDPNAAEFPHLSPSARQVYISDVIQAATTTIDEEGLEAAAATEIGMATAGAATGEPFELHVDRPFVYAIAYNDLTLFMGVVSDPR
jgi:serpin B